ncbi:hypothetical protein V6N12_002059 [Hibiscus sabdariffa]|uniref:Uncharacterized protein n=1 Tax=Hibiscus sabdariffa TaxID=183260 RepID=A0ABR1ZVU5_9ROSI
MVKLDGGCMVARWVVPQGWGAGSVRALPLEAWWCPNEVAGFRLWRLQFRGMGWSRLGVSGSWIGKVGGSSGLR